MRLVVAANTLKCVTPGEPGTPPLSVLEVSQGDKPEKRLEPAEYIEWYANAVAKGAVAPYTSGLNTYLGAAALSSDVTATHVRVALGGSDYWVPSNQGALTTVISAIYAALGEEGLAALRNALEKSVKAKSALLGEVEQKARSLRSAFTSAASAVPAYAAQATAVSGAVVDINSVFKQERDAYARTLQAFGEGLKTLRQVQGNYLRRLEGVVYLRWAMLLAENRKTIGTESERYMLPDSAQKQSANDDDESADKSQQKAERSQEKLVAEYLAMDAPTVARLRAVKGRAAFVEFRKALRALGYQRATLHLKKIAVYVAKTADFLGVSPVGFSYGDVPSRHALEALDRYNALRARIGEMFPISYQMAESVTWDHQQVDLTETDEEITQLVRDTVTACHGNLAELQKSRSDGIVFKTPNITFSTFRPGTTAFSPPEPANEDVLVTQLECTWIHGNIPPASKLPDVPPALQLAYVVTRKRDISPDPWQQPLVLAKAAELTRAEPGTVEFQVYRDYLNGLGALELRAARTEQSTGLFLTIGAVVLAPFTAGGSLAALTVYGAYHAALGVKGYIDAVGPARAVVLTELSPLIFQPSLARVVWRLVDAGIDLLPALRLVKEVAPTLVRLQQLGNAIDLLTALAED